MHKIKLEEDGKTLVETESFAAVILEREGEFYYARSLTSVQHLDESSTMVVISGVVAVLADLLATLAKKSGIEILFDTKEFLKGGENDGSNRTP